jgi:DNA-3-methyladenine glycosylase II
LSPTLQTQGKKLIFHFTTWFAVQPVHDKAIKHLSQADPVLGRLIKRIGACKLRPEKAKGEFHGPFASLVKSVAYQQLSGKAAATILGRVKALYPTVRFPSPEDLLRTSDDLLRTAGLSRAKVASIKDISAKTLAGIVPDATAIGKMSDAEIVERLTVIRGVGPWTVEMLLIFKLGRPDILPVSDYGVRKGFALTYRMKDLPSPAALREHGEKWKPYRSIAAWYLWRSLE